MIYSNIRSTFLACMASFKCISKKLLALLLTISLIVQCFPVPAVWAGAGPGGDEDLDGGRDGAVQSVVVLPNEPLDGTGGGIINDPDYNPSNTSINVPGGIALDYAGHWAEEPINYLKSRGIIIGYENGDIRPEASITRGEFVTAVNKAFNFVEESEDNFPDIDDGAWYASQFRKARQRGYIKGDENGNALPENDITRAEVVVLFTNMLKIEPMATSSSFVDAAETPDWAMNSLIAMEERNYIFGYTDGTFQPLRILTRAESFAIIARIRMIVLSDPELSEDFDIPEDDIPYGAATPAPVPTPYTAPSAGRSPAPASTPRSSSGPAPTSTLPPGTGGSPAPSPGATPSSSPEPTEEPTPTPTPLPPRLAISVAGERRENRKLTISGVCSTGDGTDYDDLISGGKLTLTIKPLDQNVPLSAIRIDYDSARDDYNELIIKRAGDYEITFEYEGPRGAAVTTQVITIAPDLPPIADFKLNRNYYRDEGVNIADETSTERGDEITEWVWTVTPDKDGTGTFPDADAETFASTVSGLLAYLAEGVGKYQVKLGVTETFENTIPKFLDDGDYLSGESEPMIFEVRNRAPNISGAAQKLKQIDIAATFGEISPTREIAFGDALKQVVANLEIRGYAVNLSGISEIYHEYEKWDVFEHENYSSNYLSTRAHSIVWDGDEVTMLGYNYEAYKDILFRPDEDPSEKTLSFDMWRDRTDWHSMEGGGFLFNTNIDTDEDTIEGYAILVTTNGLRLFRINKNRLTYFRNGGSTANGSGTGNGMSVYGQLLRTVNIGSAIDLYNLHSFKIVATPTTVSVWHNGDLVIDNFNLPIEAISYGFGPITAHASHSCSQLSYFTFSELRMGIDESETLGDILDKHEWTPGAKRVAVHISDGVVKDLSEDDGKVIGRTAAGIDRQGIDYYAVSIPGSADGSTPGSAGEFDALLKNVISGAELDGEDIDAFIAAFTELLAKSLEADPLPRLLTPDDKIYHNYTFADPDGDPMGDIEYLYSHDINGYPANTGLIEDNGAFGAPRESLGKIGEYDIYVRANDVPSQNPALAAAYSRWSDTTSLGRITVHNMPKALLSGSLSAGPEGTGGAVLTLTQSSYDPDFASEPNRGIVASEWKWKALADDVWTAGQPPQILPYEDEYLVYYRVQDGHGAWSVPATLYFSTIGMTPVIIGPDTEPPEITLITYNANDWNNLILTETFNVGDSVWLEAGATDNDRVASFELYVEGKLISQTYGRNIFSFNTPGIKTVEAVARDASGNEARETLILTVNGIDRTPPQIILHQPASGDRITGITEIIVTIADNVGVASWKLELKPSGENDYGIISQGTEAVNRAQIGMIEPEDMAEGTHAYRVTAADAAGNTSWIDFQFTISRNPSNNDRTSPIAEIIYPAHNSVVDGMVNIIGTAKDETALASYTLTLIAPDNSRTQLAAGQSNVENGTLANWDTTLYVDGIYWLMLVAVDTAGNSKSLLSSAYVNNRDRSAPRLEFVAPKHADVLSGIVPVRVKVEDSAAIESYELGIRSADPSASDDDYTVLARGIGVVGGGAAIYDWNTLNYPDGTYALRLTAQNVDGGYSWLVIYVVVDNGAGLSKDIELIVNNGVYYANINTQVPIRVAASDSYLLSTLEIKVANEALPGGAALPVSADGRAFYVPPTPGIYEVTATINDKSGGQTTLTAEFRAIDPADYMVPEVNITSPANGASLSSFVEIRGTVTAGGLVRYTLEYAPVAGNGAIGEYRLLAEGIKPVSNGRLGQLDTTVLANGNYRIKLTGYGANGSSYHEINVTVAQRNDPPYLEFVNPVHGGAVSGAAPIRAIIADMTAITSYELSFKTADAPATAYETLAAGSGQSDGADALCTWNTSQLAEGVYALRLTARNTGGAGTTLTIYVTVERGIVSDRLELIVNNGQSYANINSVVPIRVIAGDVYDFSTLVIKVDGVQIPAAADGATSYAASFTANRLGVYEITADIRSFSGEARVLSAEIQIVDPSDNRRPEVGIRSPADGAALTAPTDITGFVTDNGLIRYTLQYAPARSNAFKTLTEGTAAIDGKLAEFDTTLLENGYYDILLTGYGASGSNSELITVSVEGNMKIGNFSVEFRDIDIPVAGFPLTVTRKYDSRNRDSSGDFGYGWTMSLTSVKLSENTHPAYDWGMQSGGGLIPTYYWFEYKMHEISIDWGGGRVEKFGMRLNPASSVLYPFQYGISATYLAYSGTTSRLEALGATSDLIFLGTAGVLYDSNLMPFRPTAYRLTTQNGTVYIIGLDDGVRSITDPNGNTITLDRNGARHSDGKSIVFERGAGNRITKISGPGGATVEYQYNAAGELTSVKDVSGYETRFAYSNGHFLEDIIDPRGVRVARNEYDDSGRLIAVIDANGRRLEYDNDIDGRKQIVTDRLGNATEYTYDERGNVLSVTDPLGHATINEYDLNGNLTSQKDALGNETSYDYASNGKLHSITDSLGNKVSNAYDSRGFVTTVSNKEIMQFTITYDSRGNPVEVENAGGSKNEYAYDAKGQLTGVVDEIGQFINISYDAAGNVASLARADGANASFAYDSSGNCISKTETRTGANGAEVLTENYLYDNAGRLVKTIKADGSTVASEYNSIGKLSASTDEKGRRTVYTYDVFGNIARIAYSDGTFEAFEYDIEGRNISATDRSGQVVAMTYDAMGNLLTKSYTNGAIEKFVYDEKYRLIEYTSQNEGVTRYEYDAADRNTAVIDALGNRTEYTYNSLSQMTSMIDARGYTYQYEYDSGGNRSKIIMPDDTSVVSVFNVRKLLVSQIDQNGCETKYTYNGTDKLQSVTDAEGGLWRYSYNSSGNLEEIRDALGHVTKYEYDKAGRVVKTINASGKVSTAEFDESGCMLSSTDFAGVKTTYLYDNEDRLIRKDTGSLWVSYTYSPDGRFLSATDATGVIEYSYSAYGELTLVEYPGGTYIRYEYDKAHRLTVLQTPYDYIIYSYDLLDRMVSVEDANGITLYSYDAVGNRTKVAYPNGISAEYTYDNLNRLIGENVKDSMGAVVASYTYALGLKGERLGATELGRVVEYEYDRLYRLIGEKTTSGSETIASLYEYDAASNRIKKTINGAVTTYSYNELNQLISEVGAETIVYAYDDAGNLLAKTSAGKNTTYTYDAWNRLTSVVKTEGSDTGTETYHYDYAGNRTAKTTNGVTTRYLVDDNTEYAQVLAEVDGAGNLKACYTWGTELISRAAGGSALWYIFDGHSDTRMLVDSDCIITDEYTFDAWGNLQAHVGATDNPFLYCGEQYDALTGLYYLRARYMDPATGMFVSMDTYQGSEYDPISLHKYLYANANPVMYDDPSGMFAMSLPSFSLSFTIDMASFYFALKVVGTIAGTLLASYLLSKTGVDIGASITAFVQSLSLGDALEVIKLVTMAMAIVIMAVPSAIDIGAINAAQVRAWAESRKEIKVENLKNTSVYLIKSLESGNVNYVGITTNYPARNYRHQIMPGARFPIAKFYMMPIATNMPWPLARAMEQMLIEAYTIQNLANTINSIAEKNLKNFKGDFEALSNMMICRTESIYDIGIF